MYSKSKNVLLHDYSEVTREYIKLFKKTNIFSIPFLKSILLQTKQHLPHPSLSTHVLRLSFVSIMMLGIVNNMEV